MPPSYGFASAPGPRSWQKALPSTEEPLTADVRDAGVRWHEKTLKGYETFLALVALHYPEPKQLEEWTYFSQLNQRDALRHAIEHFRRSTTCKGSLIWQLNDCWPVQSWAVLDSEGDEKAAAHELRRLYAPALASLVVTEASVRLFTILDNSEGTLNLPVRLEARSLLDGHLLAELETHDPRASGTKARARARRPRLSRGSRRSWLERLLGPRRSAYSRSPARPPGDAAPHRGARRVGLRPQHVPVVDLFLWDPEGATRFEPNFVPGRAAASVARQSATPVFARPQPRGSHRHCSRDSSECVGRAGPQRWVPRSRALAALRRAKEREPPAAGAVATSNADPLFARPEPPATGPPDSGRDGAGGAVLP